MAVREYEFVVGPTTATQPTAGTPTNDEDFITKGYADDNYGGGGGGSITWTAPDGIAPVKTQVFNTDVFKFDPNSTDQRLISFIKVPQSYLAGKPIKMYIGIFSASSSNNILMATDAYLIRADTDSVSSVTNKHDSTNTEITNSSANQYREIELDLSDSSGEINSVAISAGDMIRVELLRNSAGETTSDTNETNMIPSSTEVTFR